jgi:hypothetical protein
MTMEKRFNRREQLDFLSEQSVSDLLVKQIRKLHWIGMESEADRLKMTLGHLARADSVLASPIDTD